MIVRILIHNHIDYFAFPMARLYEKPTITTTHGRLDLPEVQRVYKDFSDQALVSISYDQRTYLPDANWIDTCGHERGTMCWRWIRAQDLPQPQTRVVQLAQVRSGAV